MPVRTRLTRRRFDLLDALAHGDSNSQIEQRLDLGRSTIERELTELYREIGVESRVQAVRWYVDHYPNEVLRNPVYSEKQQSFAKLLRNRRRQVFGENLDGLSNCLGRILGRRIPESTLELFEQGLSYPSVQVERALQECLGVGDDPILTMAYALDINVGIAMALSRKVAVATGGEP